MMTSQRKTLSPLLLATTNQKKRLELEKLLAPFAISLVTLADFPAGEAVEETGSTFQENADLKALTQAKRHRCWTIGEDSGLCVPVLDNAPGIYSARFSGPDADDHANNRLLLERLANHEGSQRTAFYVSTIALANPEGEILIRSQGKCYGIILKSPQGEGGFGYDPLFWVQEYHQTFAQLGIGVKNCISHRARAFASFVTQLRGLIQSGLVQND